MKIKELPEEIQAIVFLRQAEQGNPRNAEIDLNKGQSEKGFTWSKTPEGYSFWEKIYNYSDYTEFYKKYPKLESKQYYTSIPTDVKLGDKFEVISGKSLHYSNNHKEYVGEIVTLHHNDGTKCSKFQFNDGLTRYIDWGWLKPVKKEEDYRVGDWVLLVDKRPSNWNPDGKMDEYLGTIQQIRSCRGIDYTLVGCERSCGTPWSFQKDNFVKKVDAPKKVVVPKEVIEQIRTPEKDISKKSFDKFEIGDIVCYNKSYLALFNEKQDQGVITKFTGDFDGYGKVVCVKWESGRADQNINTYWLRKKSNKLINNKTNNNGKVKSNLSFSTTSYKITGGEDVRESAVRCAKSKIKI